MKCFLVADLHGFTEQYKKLFDAILQHKPDAVFMAGDLLPATSVYGRERSDNFLKTFFIPALRKLKAELKAYYPQIFLILGNDDPRCEEVHLLKAEEEALLHYMHNKLIEWKGYQVMGLSYIPPTPFLLKDWERYDVSRFVDPGCTHPMEGHHTVEPLEDVHYFTIEENLQYLSKGIFPSKLICLFHSPPYQSNLDRADLDGQMIDYVPFDVHVGSIAIQRFFQQQQPLLGLHGHVHESSQLTGNWQDSIDRTRVFSAAWDGPELALVVFDLNNLATANRRLL